LKDEGPSRGAIAIANGLSANFDVNLVVLKKEYQHKTYINPNVRITVLKNSALWLYKYRFYKKILSSGPNFKPVSISMGFSADLVNLLARKNAIVMASVRASIPKNYLTTYGLRGHIWARLHLYVLQKMDNVLSLSYAMTKQLNAFNIERIEEIGNFIDEESLEKYRITREKKESRLVNFVFVGSISSRKKVDLIIESAKKLNESKIPASIDIVGDGELRLVFEEKVKVLGLSKSVRFHGHIPEPYNILQQADYFILPSTAEGVSRASLEALFFGIPCILRNIDANAELIESGTNGYLFNTDDQFLELIKELALSNNADFKKENLIPCFFRYKNNINKLSKLINEVYA
jgi:glycosyltransferase involved in cell wall biosynthesis